MTNAATIANEVASSYRDIRAIEQAKYDLAHLPMRQKMLKAMSRESHHTVEGIAIIRKEYAKNEERIRKAQSILEGASCVG